MRQEVFEIYTDGGSRGNPGPAAVAFVVKNERNRVIAKKARYIGRTTNNVAEYTAVIEALRWIFSNASLVKNCDLYLDSQLVANQLNGSYKIKDPKLRNLVIKVRILEAEVGKPISYHFISRRLNRAADLLVNEILNKVRP